MQVDDCSHVTPDAKQLRNMSQYVISPCSAAWMTKIIGWIFDWFVGSFALTFTKVNVSAGFSVHFGIMCYKNTVDTPSIEEMNGLILCNDAKCRLYKFFKQMLN